MMDSDESDDEGDEDIKIPLPKFEETPLKRNDLPLPPISLSHNLFNKSDNPLTTDHLELKQEDSVYDEFDQLGEFAELEGLDPDDFEGEEAREMRFMREQARLEAQGGWEHGE